MDEDSWLKILERDLYIAFVNEVVACARIPADAKMRKQVSASIRDIQQVLKHHGSFERFTLYENILAFKSHCAADIFNLLIQLRIYSPPT